MKSARPYVQSRRAEAAAATGARIIAAATELFMETGQEPTLDAVARDAGVTVQTILRRYGSKEGLFTACVETNRDQVRAEREAVTPGDLPGAIDNLLEHYDAWADRALRLAWLEERSPAAAAAVASAREVHRRWVAHAFEPQLREMSPETHRIRTALLVAATDVGTWKLLHRDQGLTREETRAALLALVQSILTPAGVSR